MERVEYAKQTRSIYWHVPARETTKRPSLDNTTAARNIQVASSSGDPISTQTTIQRPEAAARTSIGRAQPEAPSSINPMTVSSTQDEPEQVMVSREIPTETQASSEAMTVQAVGALLVEEEWATPATQQDPTPQQPDSLIDDECQPHEALTRLTRGSRKAFTRQNAS